MMDAQDYVWRMPLELYELGRLAYHTGELKLARLNHRQSIELLERGGDKIGIAENHRCLGRNALDSGKLLESRAHLRLTLETVNRLHSEGLMLSTLAALGEWHAADGNVARAVWLMALAAHHPAGTHVFRRKTSDKLADLMQTHQVESTMLLPTDNNQLQLQALCWVAVKEELLATPLPVCGQLSLLP